MQCAYLSMRAKRKLESCNNKYSFSLKQFTVKANVYLNPINHAFVSIESINI